MNVVRSFLKKAVFAIICSILGCVVCGQVSASDSGNQYLELMQMHKAEIAQACNVAMTNILHELQGLAQQYPPLSGMDSARIETYGTADSGNIGLDYEKNTHYEMYHYTSGIPASQMAPSLGKDVIGNGGAKLTVFINNMDDPAGMVPEGGDFGATYPLLLKGRNEKFELRYHLSLNSPDAALAKSVKDAIEKQTGLLRKHFQDILGVNPTAEIAQACAPVMTNILSGLQALAQQYPILSNIGSATIETKDTNYLYQHLKFWNKAHVVDTNDFKPFQGHPLIGSTMVENGGIALDVYLRNKDEPFGYNGTTFTFVSDDGKTQLDYVLLFNPYEGFKNLDQVKATGNAVQNVIENQRDILRKKLNGIIDF